MKKIFISCLVALTIISCNKNDSTKNQLPAMADSMVTTDSMTIADSLPSENDYKKLDNFKTLESFKSIEAFESAHEKYTQECLDNSGGGSGAAECFIGYEMWDRELNIYYNKLMSKLGTKEKTLLKESQQAWIKDRDKSIDFNSQLLDNEYTEPGTMYEAMRAGDVDRIMTPVNKQRALLLKTWFEFVK